VSLRDIPVPKSVRVEQHATFIYLPRWLVGEASLPATTQNLFPSLLYILAAVVLSSFMLCCGVVPLYVNNNFMIFSTVNQP